MESVNAKSKSWKNRKSENRPPAESSTDPARLVKETTNHPLREAIELRAYELYLQRGGGDGRDVEDWFEAEQELLGRQGEIYPS